MYISEVSPVLCLPTLTQTIQQVVLRLVSIEIPAENYIRIKVRNLRNVCEARFSIHQNSHNRIAILPLLFWTHKTHTHTHKRINEFHNFCPECCLIWNVFN